MGSPRPQTVGEATADDNAAYNAYQQLADVVILTSLTIAGCTLATGVAGGLADRKRPFSLLRLTGARSACCAASSSWRAPGRRSPAPPARSAPGSAPPPL